jgi:hypothetical protein
MKTLREALVSDLPDLQLAPLVARMDIQSLQIGEYRPFGEIHGWE